MAFPKQKPPPRGRFESVRLAVPVQHYPAVPLGVRTALAAVSDPDPHGKGPVQAFVRVDVLEDDLSHGRIDAAQYEAGRTFAGAWESLSRLKGSSIWRTIGKVDGSKTDVEIRMIETAERSRKVIESAKATIGETGAMFLKRVLVDGQNLAELAARPGERARTAAGEIFRWQLQQLADAWAATGPERGRIRSSHSDVS